MEEYKCVKCENDSFNLIDGGSTLYGWKMWKFKCSNCGTVLENDRFTYLLNTFHSTSEGITDVVNEFSNDIGVLTRSIEKLTKIKNNADSLDTLLKKLSFIYFEDDTELTNSPTTLATLIIKNLPNGVNGKYKVNKDKNELDCCEIKLRNELEEELGSVKVTREPKNIMIAEIKIKGSRKGEKFEIKEPFRIIPVLLRLNELFNYTT